MSMYVRPFNVTELFQNSQFENLTFSQLTFHGRFHPSTGHPLDRYR